MAGPGIECQQRVHVPDDIADTWKRRDPNRRWLTYLSARIYPEITSGRTSRRGHHNRVGFIVNSLSDNGKTPPGSGWRWGARVTRWVSQRFGGGPTGTATHGWWSQRPPAAVLAVLDGGGADVGEAVVVEQPKERPGVQRADDVLGGGARRAGHPDASGQAHLLGVFVVGLVQVLGDHPRVGHGTATPVPTGLVPPPSTALPVLVSWAVRISRAAVVTVAAVARRVSVSPWLQPIR